MTAASTRERRRERGAGLIGTIAGVTVFLAFLTVALQILLDLYTTSVVTAATYDAARLVATGTAPATAEDHARALLGGVGDDARFTWELDDPTVVRLRVEATTQHFLLPVVSGALGLDGVDRTITVRMEELQ
ncbi:MAG: hypothetical protein H0W25_19715 [Acidimicrobiia bacterium]|nr:hypothetical protein [Acidimicrobiia bacterium]